MDPQGYLTNPPTPWQEMKTFLDGQIICTRMPFFRDLLKNAAKHLGRLKELSLWAPRRRRCIIDLRAAAQTPSVLGKLCIKAVRRVSLYPETVFFIHQKTFFRKTSCPWSEVFFAVAKTFFSFWNLIYNNGFPLADFPYQRQSSLAWRKFYLFWKVATDMGNLGCIPQLLIDLLPIRVFLPLIPPWLPLIQASPPSPACVLYSFWHWVVCHWSIGLSNIECNHHHNPDKVVWWYLNWRPTIPSHQFKPSHWFAFREAI